MLRRVALLLGVALLPACTGSPVQPEPVADEVVVASFDFGESELIAEVYAQVLEDRGVPVRRELRLGPRELVLPALRQGLVDVAPEYLGSALAAVEPGAAAPSDELRSRLAAVLEPDELLVLQPSQARNVNALAVTRGTAQRLQLARTSDLRGVAPALSVTGPPECPRRPQCLPGLASTYDVTFREFVPYESESQRVAALRQGLVDVAVVFSTDGHLAAGDLVVLTDDKGLQPADSVVPVVSAQAVRQHGRRVSDALEAVSRQLDSAALTFLNWRIEVDGRDVAVEARGWLLRHDLLAR